MGHDFWTYTSRWNPQRRTTIGVKLQVLEIHSPEEIDDAAARFRDRPQALIVLPSPMMYYQRMRLAKLAQAHRLPASSMFVAFAEAGGLMGYGPDDSV
jgi:putative ABC transport system substrate-binding protein